MSLSSTYALNLQMTNSLVAQQITLTKLSDELATSKKNSDLTDYNPTDAHNILDLQNGVTHKQSFLTSINTVQTRLSMYDSSLTDIESLSAQANSLATQNQAYDPTKVDNVQQQAVNLLRQLSNDLNLQVGGRFIYAGARYSTQPVTDLSTLTGAPAASPTTSPALPSYDSQFSNATSFTVNSATAPTGNFNVGNVAISWSEIAAGQITDVYLNGSSTPTALGSAITLPNIPASTAGEYADNLSSAINGVAADTTDVPSSFGIASLTASATNGSVTLNFNGTAPLSVTPTDGAANTITWNDPGTPDGTVAQTPNSSAPAYALDSVLIDTNYNITYGITSNDPNFQKLVNGLRFMVDAVNSGKAGDTATYQSEMTQAASLIKDAASGIQVLHSQVASNQNTLTQETTVQNADITSLTNQLDDIQKVDLTQVGTEINLLQTQLQASYSATSSLEKLSLVKYL